MPELDKRFISHGLLLGNRLKLFIQEDVEILEVAAVKAFKGGAEEQEEGADL